MKWFRTSCTLSLINGSDKWWSDAEQALDDNVPISLTNESDKWWVIQGIINKWKWWSDKEQACSLTIINKWEL